MRIPSVIAAAIVSGTAVVAAAQPPQSTAEPGSRVYVTLEAGEDTLAGSLLELSAESVTILLDGQTRTFPIGEVARIQRHGDPSGDGAGKGATTIGPWCLLVCGQGTGNGREFGTAVVGNAAIGVLVGWAIDRGHVGRTTIYPAKAESRGSGSAFAVAAAQTGRQPSITPPASGASASSPTQVISFNPFGMLIELFNAEYEVRGPRGLMFGAGASTASVTTYDYDSSAPPGSVSQANGIEWVEVP